MGMWLMHRTALMLAVVGTGVAFADDGPTDPEGVGQIDAPVAASQGREGRPDAVAALQARLAEGVTPETNAVVRLWDCMGPDVARPLPDEYFERLGVDRPGRGGTPFVGLYAFLSAKDGVEADAAARQRAGGKLSRRAGRAWRAADDPDLAAWLEENERPLAVATEAASLPGYFSPLVPPSDEKGRRSVYHCLLPGTQCCRDIGRAFLVRAMLRLGEGDADAAWSDLLACHRLGRLVARGGTLVDLLVADALDTSASRAGFVFLEAVEHDEDRVARCLRDLESLPDLPTVGECVDRWERVAMLDTVSLIGKRGFDVFETGDGGPPVWQPTRFVGDLVLKSLDWEPALETVDAWFDRLVADLAEPDRASRAEKLARFGTEVQRLKNQADGGRAIARLLLAGKPAGRALSRSIGEITVGLLMPATDAAVVAADRRRQTHDILLAAFALARFRGVHGRYPGTLAELSPDVLDRVPGDLFRGGELTFRPHDEGYLLYGVGPNLRDDGGPSAGDESSGDDIGVRVPRSTGG